MKEWKKKIGRMLFVLLGGGLCISCAPAKGTQQAREGQQLVCLSWQGENADEKAQMPNAEAEAFSLERQRKENETYFFEEAKRQNVEADLAKACFERLLEEEIFKKGAMALTGLRMDDIDGNGKTDMLVMVQDARETPFYGSGSLWFYMNEDEPYCFSEEECSYYGWFDAFWADIDNDGQIEIVFWAQGTGCGGAGDSYKAVFKYRNHKVERMELPSDFEEDYDCGLQVELIQETAVNSYCAYCPYLDDQISFCGENSFVPPDTPQLVGGNVRGYCDLRPAEYEGKTVLQASEYLHGEGGTVHYVGSAQFLITWEEDGTPTVVKWWIEEAN
mgnify:CR=1 FL=1